MRIAAALGVEVGDLLPRIDLSVTRSIRSLPPSLGVNQASAMSADQSAPKEGTLQWRVPIGDLPQYVQREDRVAELKRTPEGGLSFTVTYADGACLTFECEPIRIPGGQRVHILATWIEPAVVLEVNGEALEPYRPGQVTREIELPNSPVLAPSALDHPDRIHRCQPWINSRRDYFTGLVSRGRNRRPKTVEEQCDDLRGACASIDHLLGEIEQGKLFLAAYVAGTLRALVVWAYNERYRSSYNALLLRLANLVALPLPVWADPNPIPESSNAEHSICVSGNFAHLMQAEPQEELMDLQQWLATPVVAQWDPIAKVERRVSVRDMIGEISNTLGGSHFDSDSSVFGDTLLSIRSGNTSYWLKFLGGCSDIVGAYSKWVLDELHRAGVINRGYHQ